MLRNQTHQLNLGKRLFEKTHLVSFLLFQLRPKLAQATTHVDCLYLWVMGPYMLHHFQAVFLRHMDIGYD